MVEYAQKSRVCGWVQPCWPAVLSPCTLVPRQPSSVLCSSVRCAGVPDHLLQAEARPEAAEAGRPARGGREDPLPCDARRQTTYQDRPRGGADRKSSREKFPPFARAMASALNRSNTARWPAAPSARALAGSARRVAIASARAWGSSAAHSRPPPVASISSGKAPRRGCTTGTPAASASNDVEAEGFGAAGRDRKEPKASAGSASLAARSRLGWNSASPSKPAACNCRARNSRKRCRPARNCRPGAA